MSTKNFEHINSWSNMYEYAEMVEKHFYKNTKAEICSGMGTIRKILEEMVGILCYNNAISYVEVEYACKQIGKTEGRNNLYSKIVALNYFEIIDNECANNFHTMRSLANKGEHANDPNGDYYNMSIDKIRLEAEELYQLLYLESINFVNKYVLIRNTKPRNYNINNSKSTTKSYRKNEDVNQKNIILFMKVLTTTCIICFIVFCMNTINSSSTTVAKKINKAVEQENLYGEYEQQNKDNMSQQSVERIGDNNYLQEDIKMDENDNKSNNESTNETLESSNGENESEEVSEPLIDSGIDTVYAKAINQFRSAWYNNYDISVGDLSSPRCMQVWSGSGIEGTYSTDETVVSIDANGVVSGVGKGSAYVVIWMGGQVADVSLYHVN